MSPIALYKIRSIRLSGDSRKMKIEALLPSSVNIRLYTHGGNSTKNSQLLGLKSFVVRKLNSFCGHVPWNSEVQIRLLLGCVRSPKCMRARHPF